MTLPSSGTMSAAMVNNELGRPSNAVFSMNGASERALAGVASGPYSMASFYGKTAGGGGGGKTSSFNGTGSGGSGTTVNVGSVPFGAAAADRTVVCAIHWTFSGGINRTISSATIGGIAAGVQVQAAQDGGASGQGVGIIAVGVPSGTSGTVSITFSGAVSTVVVGSYRLAGGFTALLDADSAVSETPTTDLSVTITTGAAGCVIAGYISSNADLNSWSGVFSNYSGGASNGSVGAGSLGVTADITPEAIGGNQLVVTSWV